MDPVHCRGGKEGGRVRFPHGSGTVHEGAEIHEARGSDGEHRPRDGRSSVPAPAPPDSPEQAADFPRMMEVGATDRNPYMARAVRRAAIAGKEHTGLISSFRGGPHDIHPRS